MSRLTAMALAAAFALGAAPAASAATQLSANWSDACGGGSNCFNDQGVFQQTFSAGSFSGLVTIGQLLLDRSILGDLDGKTFRLSFTLNGEELGSWGSWTMGGIGGDQLSFDGADFVWDPQDGDLVLVLEILRPTTGGGGGGFAGLALQSFEDGPSFPSNIVDDPGPGGDQQQQQDELRVSPAPEPSSWALMILGFGAAGAILRRRRPALA